MTPACPACGCDLADPVVSLHDVPVLPNSACATHDEAREVPRGDIQLAVCLRCGHLYNTAYDPAKLSYDARYENSLGFSPSFQRYVGALADRLTRLHGVVGGTVAELGSGPGEFLVLLAERGVGRAVGFDPSHDPERTATPSDPVVIVERRTYPLDGELRPDLLIARHVVEHLADPFRVLKAIGSTLAEGAHVYLEVPNAESMVRRTTLWDLIYEHRSYFTASSLRTLAGRCGLTTIDCREDYDDQFLSVTTRAGRRCVGSHESVDPAWFADVARFGAEVSREISRCRQRLRELAGRGPVALWGAGSKGIMYCNLVAADGGLSTVVDVNPRKAGTFVAGTGHEIQSPSALLRRPPATVLLSNPLYEAEVKAHLVDLAPDAELHVLWT